MHELEFEYRDTFNDVVYPFLDGQINGGGHPVRTRDSTNFP